MLYPTNEGEDIYKNYNMTNKKTAKLMIKIMKYVIENDYYPNDYFTLLELQKELSNDLISVKQFTNEIDKMYKEWQKN